MDSLLLGLFVVGVAIALGVAVALRVQSAWQLHRAAGGDSGGGDDAANEPRCRQCGYIVAPRARRICPECGGDLRAVGVFARRVRRRPDDPVGWIVGTGVLLAPFAIIAAYMVDDYLPAVFRRYAVTTTIATRLPATRPGEPGPVIEVSAHGWRALRHQPPTVLDVSWWSFSDDGMRWSVEFYKKENQRKWRWDAPERKQAATTRPTFGTVEAFDETAARRFVQLAGVDPDAPAGAALAAQTLEQVRRLQQREFPRGVVRQRDGNESPAVTYFGGGFARTLVVAGIVWLPPWWLLARRLRRRFERRLRAAKSQEQSTLDTLGVER